LHYKTYNINKIWKKSKVGAKLNLRPFYVLCGDWRKNKDHSSMQRLKRCHLIQTYFFFGNP
jgi:hypothetical protein